VNVTLLLVGLVVFAFFVGHVLHRYVSRYAALSGAEYVLVGALIGPQLPPRLVTTDSLQELVPLMSLLLGLTGFLVGLRARRTFGGWKYGTVGTFSSVGTLSVVAAVCATLTVSLGLYATTGNQLLNAPLLKWGSWVLEVHANPDQLFLGLALGAAAAVATSGLLVTIGDSLKAKSPTFELLRSSAIISQLLAVTTVGIVLAVTRGETGAFIKDLGAGGWVIGAVGLGLVCGGCFALFIGSETSTSRIFLATVGTVTFASGAGSALGVSPLFVNLVSGLAVGVISRHAGVLRKELDRLQHPIFVLLLILTGAMWTPVSGLLWLFPVVYVTARLLAGRLLLGALTRLLTDINPERIGYGLLAQGTLAVAVAVDYALQVPAHAPVVLTTVLFGTLICDMRAGGIVRRVLVDAEADSIHLGSESVGGLTAREAGL
jgi:hypothetical protein